MLSKRAQRAVEVLKAGGLFRYGLERQWGGYEQFQARLQVKGRNVPGYGYAAYNELREAGLLKQVGKSSSVSSYYGLQPAYGPEEDSVVAQRAAWWDAGMQASLGGV